MRARAQAAARAAAGAARAAAAAARTGVARERCRRKLEERLAAGPSGAPYSESAVRALLKSALHEKTLQTSPEVVILWTPGEDDGDDDEPDEPKPAPVGFGGFLLAKLGEVLEPKLAELGSLAKQGKLDTIASCLNVSVSRDPFLSPDIGTAQTLSAFNALSCLLDRPAALNGGMLHVGCAVLQFSTDSEKLPEMEWSDLFRLSQSQSQGYPPNGQTSFPAWQRAERRMGALLAGLCREEVPAGLLHDGDPPVDVDFKKRRAGLIGCTRLMLDVASKYKPPTGGFEGTHWAQAVGLITQSLRLVGRVLWWQYCPQSQNYKSIPDLEAPPADAPPSLHVLVLPGARHRNDAVRAQLNAGSSELYTCAAAREAHSASAATNAHLRTAAAFPRRDMARPRPPRSCVRQAPARS